MFQLYLLFNKIRSEPLEEIFDLLPTTSPRNWPLISVLVSILALAISFTVNYRENKENSMGFGATLVYFVYIIMELCRRRSLMELHKRRKAITEPETRYFMNQILLGVKYLHDKKIIHRDLKLGNIFLNDNMEVSEKDILLTSLTSSPEWFVSL